jgi:murein DD-endopeptidase MepM/ murein hydrolase activator NlpD
VTSDFGYRRSPFTLASDFHKGIDIAAAWGTPVAAPADGVVKFAGYKGGYGKMVVIDHGFGVVTKYGHTSEIFVREGDKIKRGSKIALVGNTGHSTGPHLHYEIQSDGLPVDPMQYILK